MKEGSWKTWQAGCTAARVRSTRGGAGGRGGGGFRGRARAPRCRRAVARSRPPPFRLPGVWKKFHSWRRSTSVRSASGPRPSPSTAAHVNAPAPSSAPYSSSPLTHSRTPPSAAPYPVAGGRPPSASGAKLLALAVLLTPHVVRFAKSPTCALRQVESRERDLGPPSARRSWSPVRRLWRPPASGFTAFGPRDRPPEPLSPPLTSACPRIPRARQGADLWGKPVGGAGRFKPDAGRLKARGGG